MPNNNRLQLVWAGLARNNRWSSYICQKDVDTFNRRMEGEGPEFYARALGRYRTALLTGIGKGTFESVQGFGPKRETVLPRFLFNAMCRIFDEKTGVLRDDIDVDAVACVNQLTAVFTKIDGGHTPQSEINVIESFVKTEKDMASTSIDWEMRLPYYHTESVLWGENSTWDRVLRSWDSLDSIMDRASRLVKRVLAGADPREISPKHGSGVSACGTKVRDRYAAPRFVDKIDKIWPMSEYYYFSSTAFCDGLQEYIEAPVLDPCAKVLLVPKDARGPRLISCEPRETMWIQQGLMGLLYDTIEGHYLTRGRVNFTRQGFNQRAAFYGSLLPEVAGRRVSTNPISRLPMEDEAGRDSHRDPEEDYAYAYYKRMSSGMTGVFGEDSPHLALDPQAKIAVRQARTEKYLRDRGLHLDPRSPVAGKLATLDLKDASDRLRLDVVERLFPSNWVEALKAARSESTKLPDGRVINLTKHAPMGSACCFPVMALVIWAVLTAIAPRGAARHILVYGDDIVVPTFMTSEAIQLLEAIGLMVNKDKSFWQGPFRESCGEEYVCGCRVTPVRLRQHLDDNYESLMSAMAFSNNMLDDIMLTDNGWFLEHLIDWYGPKRVPITLRTPKRDVSWISQADRLEVGLTSRYVTLSGVAFTDDPSRVNLPLGRNVKMHGFNAPVNKPAYWVPMHRITVPTPVLEEFEPCDWCHVLRSHLNRCESQSGFDPIHNRIRYTRQWRRLD